MKIHKTLIRLVLSVLLTISIWGAQEVLAAQDDDGGEPAIVTYVEIRGNTTVATSLILSQIRTEIGRPVSSNLLSDDLKRLYGLNYFKDVRIEQDRSQGGLKIIFTVAEKPVLTSLEIRGYQKISKKDIQKSLKVSKGDYVDEQRIRSDVQAVRALYEEKGYFDAKIDYRLTVNEKTNQADLALEIDEGAKKKVRSIVFEGAASIGERELRKGIQTKESAWYRSGLVREDQLDLDVQRIIALYDQHGFSDAAVEFRMEPVENEPEFVKLIFKISEGRQYLVGGVAIEGNVSYTYDEVLESLDMKPGAAFSRRGLRQSVSKIQDLYFEKGYMDAKILFDSVYNDASGLVDTKYTITENEITHVGRVHVEGNIKTKDTVIRRELRAYPGEPFNGVALKRSKERLYNLGFFEEVQFDITDTGEKNVKDLVVRVKEAKTGQFSFGGGFSSIDKVLGFAQIQQRNFDYNKYPTFMGGGQDLRLRLEVSEIRTNGELSWTDPWIMGQPYSFGFDIFRKEFNRTRSTGLFFDETRTGGRLRLGKELTDHDQISLRYRLDNIEISDIPASASPEIRREEGDTLISGLSATYTRDYRNNRFVPTKGYILQGAPEYVGGFIGGDKDFYRFNGMAAIYFKNSMDWVLEIKGRGGYSNPFDDTERVPIFERYYVGGANTIRGYRERRVGPRDSGTKDPVGGETYWIGNFEYTFPIYPNVVKGALFYDVGAAYLDSPGVDDGDIAAGAGVGVRVKTPIGPVKVDLGYPLDEIEGEDKEVRFHFNISQGF